MDPTHHEKIVDKLMQYRGKIPKSGQLGDSDAIYYTKELRNEIDSLIQHIDFIAKAFNKGLIR